MEPFGTVELHTDTEDKIESVTYNSEYTELWAFYTLLHDTFTSYGKATEAVMATFLLYFLISPDIGKGMITAILQHTTSYSDLCAMLKYEGRIAKQLQHARRSDLNTIFELDVLINRIDDTVDWAKEIANRTTDMQLCPIDRDTVYKHAKDIFLSSLSAGQVPKRQEWKHYWAQRWALMPVGSFVSQYQDDVDFKKSLDIGDKANKTTVLCAMAELSHETIAIHRPPEIHATTSTKYEWGKVRALYGCDITSFLNADFVLGNADDILPGYFPVGERATESNVARIFKALRGIPVCYDYDDFNSQHSVTSMRAVLEAWRDVYLHYLSFEQSQSLDWTIRSIDHMAALVPNHTTRVRIEGTFQWLAFD